MTEALLDFPVVSIDTHFRNVSNFEQIDMNAQLYGTMLVELGVPPEKAGSNNTIYIRPDYELAYTRRERFVKFLQNPGDYTDAGSCVENNQGGVDIVIVYGAGYGVNKLLRHETHHAIKMLTEPDNASPSLLTALRRVLSMKKVVDQEELDADKLMKESHLKSKYGKLITVEKPKQ